MDANVVHPVGKAELFRVLPTKTWFWYMYRGTCQRFGDYLSSPRTSLLRFKKLRSLSPDCIRLPRPATLFFLKAQRFFVRHGEVL